MRFVALIDFSFDVSILLNLSASSSSSSSAGVVYSTASHKIRPVKIREIRNTQKEREKERK